MKKKRPKRGTSETDREHEEGKKVHFLSRTKRLIVHKTLNQDSTRRSKHPEILSWQDVREMMVYGHKQMVHPVTRMQTHTLETSRLCLHCAANSQSLLQISLN